MSRVRISLTQAFSLANLGLLVLLSLLVYGISSGSRRSVIETSELTRRATSAAIGELLRGSFDNAEQVIDALEGRMRTGLGDADAPLSVEATLLGLVLDHPGLAALSFTRPGPDAFEMVVYRETADPDSPMHTRWVHREEGRFVADERLRPGGARLLAVPWTRSSGPAPEDPTTQPALGHASRTAAGPAPHRAAWSDLGYAGVDRDLPEAERRAIVIATRPVRGRDGALDGIARLAYRAELVDSVIVQIQKRARPQRVVLCDAAGRLITRIESGDARASEPDGALRVPRTHVPAEIARALELPALRQVGAERDEASARFELDGRPFLASFRALPVPEGWRVAVVVAEDELPGLASQIRRRNWLLAFAGLLSALILGGGLLSLRWVRRDLGRIERSASRMRSFDFSPSPSEAPFHDVAEVLQGLELAKTAMRALSRYVPVDLVRTLYRTGREPQLGGELLPVTLLFCDIKGFTTLSEQLSPNELAELLGRYLEVMTAAFQRHGGTVDKYIGDAIMTVWNAPTPCVDHPQKACEAALAAVAATEVLYASPEWAGRPALFTRFGLHTDEVLVGHFGAPDRMSYTCLGDGVNLASRLEGLNKPYGTTIMVSDAVRQAVKPDLAFRFLDVVAVSGKGQAVRVHELLGTADLADGRRETARRYEEALALYLRRDFRAALDGFLALDGDGPSALLAARCRRLIADPPPDDWDGSYVAASK
jgi:adenylate cyclase